MAVLALRFYQANAIRSLVVLPTYRTSSVDHPRGRRGLSGIEPGFLDERIDAAVTVDAAGLVEEEWKRWG